MPIEYDEYGRPIVPGAIAPQMSIMSPAQRAAIPPTPDFSPYQVQPSAPTPSQQVTANIHPLDPNAKEFHNSRMRTFLNALAGGLAGAAGGPEAGIRVADSLRNAKFNQAQAQQDRILHLAQLQGQGEQEQIQRGTEAARLGIQRGTGMINAQTKSADEIRKENELKNKEINTQSLIQSRTDRSRLAEDKMMQLPASLREAMTVAKMDDDQKMAIAEGYLIAHPKPGPEDKIQSKIDIESAPENRPKLRKIYEDRQFGSSTGRVMGETTPEARDLQAELAAAKTTATEDAKTDAMNNPERIAGISKQAWARSDAALTANQKQTRTGAIEILAEYPRINSNLDNLIKTGKLDTTLQSRWNDFMTGTLGTNDPSLVALRTDLGFLQSKLSQIHTTRTSNEVLKKFESLMSAKVMTAKTLKDSISTVENWVKEYAKDPRVVEQEYEKAHPSTPDTKKDDDFWNSLIIKKK